MKTPSHSTPQYLCPRLRKILAAKGWAISKTTGRYAPFANNTQQVTEGFRVSRVGCSKSISISYSGALFDGRPRDVPKDVRKACNEEAWSYLRSLGYRVDEKGWIECDGYGD